MQIIILGYLIADDMMASCCQPGIMAISGNEPQPYGLKISPHPQGTVAFVSSVNKPVQSGVPKFPLLSNISVHISSRCLSAFSSPIRLLGKSAEGSLTSIAVLDSVGGGGSSTAIGLIKGDDTVPGLPFFQCFCSTPIRALVPSRTVGEDCWALLNMRHASNTSSLRLSASISSQLKHTSIRRITAAINTWCITDQTTELGGINFGSSSSMILLISMTLRAD